MFVLLTNVFCFKWIIRLPSADYFEMKINNIGESTMVDTNYFVQIVDKLKHLIEGVNVSV